MAPSRVLKRPACAIAQPEPAAYEATECQWQRGSSMAEEPGWASWPQGREVPAIPWADHMIRALVTHGHLPPQASKSPTLNVWSDCSGINSEMFALKDLSRKLKRIIGADIQWSLHFICESDPKSITFAKDNHGPRHISTDMKQRNFSTGEYWCESCGQNHPLPRSGVDLYVGTYPCSPWSRRGPRTSWDHPSVEAFRIGVETIAFAHPAVWIIEVGELPQESAVDEVVTAIQQACHQGGRQYTIQPIRNLTPAFAGYPIKRPRTFFLGWRADVGSAVVVTGAAATLLQNPLDVTMSYRGFLGTMRPYDWSGVDEYLAGSMLEFATSSPCMCSCDPMVMCPLHPCKCGRCGADGLACAWRKLCTDQLAHSGMAATERKTVGKGTYLQALESQGGTGPQQQRARVLLNMFAVDPRHQPLKDTLALIDTSQNPPFGSYPTDGLAPTLTTTSQLWCLSAGRFLESWELAALMGLDTRTFKLKSHSDAWFRKRLGLAVSVPNFGLALMAAMAAPLRRVLDGQ